MVKLCFLWSTNLPASIWQHLTVSNVSDLFSYCYSLYKSITTFIHIVPVIQLHLI